jgi:hypothetical protein
MIRNIGFLSWKQESSWMESMKGPRWNSMVKRENSIFKNALDKVTSEEYLLQKQNEFKNSIGSMFFTYNNIVIKTINNSEYELTYDSKTYNVTDLEISDNYVYHIDSGSSRGFDNAYGRINNIEQENKFLFSKTPSILLIDQSSGHDKINIIKSKMRNTRIHLPRPNYETIVRQNENLHYNHPYNYD